MGLQFDRSVFLIMDHKFSHFDIVKHLNFYYPTDLQSHYYMKRKFLIIRKFYSYLTC